MIEEPVNAGAAELAFETVFSMEGLVEGAGFLTTGSAGFHSCSCNRMIDLVRVGLLRCLDFDGVD